MQLGFSGEMLGDGNPSVVFPDTTLVPIGVATVAQVDITVVAMDRGNLLPAIAL